MAPHDQAFLEQITNMHGTDFESWQGWEQLMSWTKRQTWREDFFGNGKIPAKFLHPQTLVQELTKYLGSN